MADCHWCAELQESHDVHAVVKGYFDMVFALSEARELLEEVQGRNEHLRAEIAEAKDDVLVEARNKFGVHRREWASVLDREWNNLKKRLSAMMGIPISGEPPWLSAVERAKKERRIQQEDESRKAIVPKRQATADRFQGEI